MKKNSNKLSDTINDYLAEKLISTKVNTVNTDTLHAGEEFLNKKPLNHVKFITELLHSPEDKTPKLVSLLKTLGHDQRFGK